MDRTTTIEVVIALYVVLMVVIGVVNSKSSKGGMANFTVGGRNAGAWISALSYGTAYFSAVMFIGYSGGSGWNFGLWSVLVGIGNAVIGTLLAWIVLANRTREVTKRMKIKSMPQFFEVRYESRAMKTFACFVIFIFLIPYSASVYKGLSSVCSVLLGVSEDRCMIVIAGASAIVLIIGGYMATLKADFVQGFVMMFGVSALIVMVVISPQIGGLSQGVENMMSYMKDNGLAPMDMNTTVALISMILMTSFGTWGLPQMIHKYYGIRDKREVKRGIIISSFFSLLVAGGGYFIGSFSHLFFGDTLPSGGKDHIIPVILNSAGLPNILIGVVLVLLISASVSTLSSIALTACSSLSMDFIKASVKKNMPDQYVSFITRILCLLFVVLSYLIAYYPTSILEMTSYSWGVLSGAFLAPYAVALYWKGLNKAGAWAGMLGGFLTSFVPVCLSEFKTPNGPLYAVLAMAVSLILCLAVSVLASKLGWRSGARNDFFYTGTGDEWRKRHGIVKF